MEAKSRLQRICALAVPFALVALGSLATRPVWAQGATDGGRPAASAKTKAVAAGEAAGKDGEKPAAKTGKPGGEGVTIHGHWTIDVRNPDGKLVEHRDFENSLVTVGALVSGDQLLAGLLAGSLSVGDPAIGFVQGTLGSDPSTYCNIAQPPSSDTTCYGLTTAASTLTSVLPNFVTGLGTTYTFGPSVNWTMTGAYTVPATLKSITATQTLVTVCVSEVAPFFGHTVAQFTGGPWTGRADPIGSGNCNPTAGTDVIGAYNVYRVYSTLTSTKVSPALAVTEGQVITATVVISFS
jgi:hypothetical protein